jgi:carboxylesterase type B
MTPYGPLHAADIFYVFGNFVSSGIAPTLASLELSRRIQRAWGSFARTGSPSWEGGWPSMAGEPSEFLEIDLLPSVESGYRGGRCDALRELGVLP